MGKQEYKESGGKLAVGKKISLRHLLSAYSRQPKLIETYWKMPKRNNNIGRI